jgi:hypothetical protein
VSSPLTGAPLQAALRQLVGELRARERRRVFDSRLHLGRPEAAATFVEVASRDVPLLDQALRRELAAELVERVSPADLGRLGGTPTTGAGSTDAAPEPGLLAWLTRPGDVEELETDLDWLAATSCAAAERDLRLERFVVVTRYGWRDARTGEHRRWKRLRL